MWSRLSRDTYKSPSTALPLIWYENIWGYFEVNPVATIPMNRTGIKFLVASSELFFGQPEGDKLRATCIEKVRLTRTCSLATHFLIQI